MLGREDAPVKDRVWVLNGLRKLYKRQLADCHNTLSGVWMT